MAFKVTVKPWKSYYENKVFSLGDSVEFGLKKKDLERVIRLMNYILSHDRDVQFNDAVKNNYFICYDEESVNTDIIELCNNMKNDLNIYNSSSDSNDTVLSENVLSMIFNKDFIESVISLYKEECDLLEIKRERLDLTTVDSIETLFQKLFHSLDEKIFYRPFTFFIQNLFVLLIQTYCVQSAIVKDSIFNKEELICNRIGTYFKYWLNIHEDKDVVTSDEKLYEILTEKLRKDVFKQLTGVFRKSVVAYVKDYKKRLQFNNESLEKFVDKNFVFNPNNPNILYDVYNILTNILIETFPKSQNFVTELSGQLLLLSMYKTDERVPNNKDYIMLGFMFKLQSIMEKKKNIFYYVKNILNVVESTPGKFIDKQIFMTWLRNENTSEIVDMMMKLSKCDPLKQITKKIYK